MSLLGFFNLNFDIKDPVVFSGLQSASKWLIYCSEQVFITLSSFPASLHALVFFFFLCNLMLLVPFTVYYLLLAVILALQLTAKL